MGIKSKGKPHNGTQRPDTILSEKIRKAFDELDSLASKGDQDAKETAYFMRWEAARKHLSKLISMAKDGETASPGPIASLLSIADTIIPELLWLAEHKKESVRNYARLRWSWPGYFHLAKQEQGRYQALLPKFDKTGNKISKESPIGVGSGLGLSINANRTRGDYLFIISAHCIKTVSNDSISNVQKGYWNTHLWICCHDQSLQILKRNDFETAIKKLFDSFGKFCKGNWSKWKPIFETFVTFHFGPDEERFQMLPEFYKSNLHAAFQMGIQKLWFGEYQKKKVLTAQELVEWEVYLQRQNPVSSVTLHHLLKKIDLASITSGRKTKVGKWGAIKTTLLKRIHSLAPAN